MRLLSSVLLLIAGSGCAVRSTSTLADPPLVPAVAASAPAADAGLPSSIEEQLVSLAVADEGAAVVEAEGAAASEDDSEADDEAKDDEAGDLGEAHDVAPVDGVVVNRYTPDLDEE